MAATFISMKKSLKVLDWDATPELFSKPHPSFQGNRYPEISLESECRSMFSEALLRYLLRNHTIHLQRLKIDFWSLFQTDISPFTEIIMLLLVITHFDNLQWNIKISSSNQFEPKWGRIIVSLQRDIQHHFDPWNQILSILKISLPVTIQLPINLFHSGKYESLGRNLSPKLTVSRYQIESERSRYHCGRPAAT